MIDGKLVELFQEGLVATVGGITNYFYYLEKHKRKLRALSFITNCILSFFVGMVIGDFMPEGDYSYGLLMIAGFCCYPILGHYEKKVIGMIEGVSSGDKK